MAVRKHPWQHEPVEVGPVLKVWMAIWVFVCLVVFPAMLIFAACQGYVPMP